MNNIAEEYVNAMNELADMLADGAKFVFKKLFRK